MKKIIAALSLLIPAVIFALGAKSSKPQLKLHQLYTDNAIFQRNVIKYPIKGRAKKNTKVTITFRGETATVTADDKGNWCAYLPSGDAGEGFELKVVSEGENLTAKNIAVGDVWLVAGQSNAEFTVGWFKQGAEWSKDSDYPLIRFQKQTWQPPHMRKDDAWQILSPKTVKNFSATGFFFAKEIWKNHKIPVGVIVSASGGSVIRSWIPESALAEIPHARKTLIEPHRKAFEKYEKEKAENPQKPPRYPFKSYSGLFNERVARLRGLPLSGVIWYQGEADAMFAGGHIYREYLEALIKSYRAHFSNAKLPFFVVEIPYYGSHYIWSDLRDSQRFTANKLDAVHLVSILDIGDLKDIHPPKKPELGARLAAVADRFVYGGKDVATGPQYESMKIADNRVILKFKPDSIGGGLVACDGKALRGFLIADSNKRFTDAQAVIEGDCVVVSSEKVKKPVAVRYGWYPPKEGVNFFNKAGYPCGLFRTDDFKLPTDRSPNK